MENSPEARIDFRLKQAFRRKNGLLSPPNSQSSQIEPARTLISPPPEEELEFIRVCLSVSSLSDLNPCRATLIQTLYRNPTRRSVKDRRYP